MSFFKMNLMMKTIFSVEGLRKKLNEEEVLDDTSIKCCNYWKS